MFLSGKGASSGDNDLATSKKGVLNPNASEFVPFALRSPAAEDSLNPSIPGKVIFDRSESSVSRNSDDEAQRYWSHQLPDDITPDFKAMGLDDAQGINNLSFSSSSLNEINEGSRYSASMGNGFMLKELQGLSHRPVSENPYSEKLRSPLTSYGEYSSPTSLHPSLAKPWDEHISNDHLLTREGPGFKNPRHSFLDSMPNEQLLMDNTEFSHLEFLASQFPNFATESLAEVYFSSAGNLDLTIEMLTQLELQVDGGQNQTLNSKTLAAPRLSAMDFPALSMRDGQNNLAKFAGDGLHQNAIPYQSSEKQGTLLLRSNSFTSSRSATDFASAVRKMPLHDPNSIWRFDRNGSPRANVGSSRGSQVLASSYSTGQGRAIHGDRLQSRDSVHASPLWLGAGETVANMYSEMREGAHDHGRVQNTYIEQARQAYLIGNKALAKELSIKGQLHNMQMKAAHEKAQEAIYRQRFVISRNLDTPTNSRERMIDLHGLHASEAIHVLKRELSVMKNAARSVDQHLLVYVCVGTGHTRGSRTPARLPIAVQRYLLEEGLDYSEPQPGLLRVVIY